MIGMHVFTALSLRGVSLLVQRYINFQSPITFFLINSIPMTKQEGIQYTFILADSFTDNISILFLISYLSFKTENTSTVPKSKNHKA